MRPFRRLRRHFLRRAQRNRVGGNERPRDAEAHGLHHGQAAFLGFEIPERAIDCVAGRARLHERLQHAALHAFHDHGQDGVDLGHHALDCLSVPSVWNTFAPSRVNTLANGADDDVRRGFRAAEMVKLPAIGKLSIVASA